MRSYITSKISKVLRIDAHYFISSGFWSSLGQIIGLIAGIITSALFAQILDETAYGTYRYIISIGLILTTFSLTGITQSIFQTAAKKYRQFYLDGIKISLIYSLGITVMSLIGFAYYFYNQNIILAVGCFLIAVFQPIINTYQSIFLFLQGSGRFRDSAILQIIKVLVVSLVCVISILLTHNILILLAAYFCINAIVNFFIHFFYKPEQTKPLSEIEKHKYIQYAKHTSIQTIIAEMAYRIDTIIIFQQLGALELATFTIANIIPEQIKGSLKNVATLILPKYTLHENIESIKIGMLRRSFELFLILLFITFIYIYISPFVYKLLFPKYETAVFYSQLAALAFPAFVAIIPVSALQSQLMNKELNMFNKISSIVSGLSTILLISFFNITGAILAKVFSRYFNMILAYYLLYRKTPSN